MQIISVFCRYGVAVSDSSGGEAEHVSFVNNVRTARGGTHVLALQRQVVRAVVDHIAAKHPALPVTTASVRRHLRLFVNARVNDPAFDSQVKDLLTTKPADFGTSLCVIQ